MQQIELFPPEPTWAALKRAVMSEEVPVGLGGRKFSRVRSSGLKQLVLAVEPSAEVRRGRGGYDCFVRNALIHPHGQPTPWQGWEYIGRHIVSRLPPDLVIEVQ